VDSLLQLGSRGGGLIGKTPLYRRSSLTEEKEPLGQAKQGGKKADSFTRQTEGGLIIKDPKGSKIKRNKGGLGYETGPRKTFVHGKKKGGKGKKKLCGVTGLSLKRNGGIWLEKKVGGGGVPCKYGRLGGKRGRGKKFMRGKHP